MARAYELVHCGQLRCSERTEATGRQSRDYYFAVVMMPDTEDEVAMGGWITKQGGKRKSWKRRWFSMRPAVHALMYGTLAKPDSNRIDLTLSRQLVRSGAAALEFSTLDRVCTPGLRSIQLIRGQPLIMGTTPVI